jgi:DNA-binding CsgD family transcriptional regulator
MTRLSASDLEAVVAFAATAAIATADADADARRTWVIEHVAALIPCDAGAYVATDDGALMRGTTRWWGACPVVREDPLEPTSGRTPPLAGSRLVDLHRRQNPYYRHFRRIGGSNTVRVSDIVDVEAFARTELAWAIFWSDAPYSMQLRVSDGSGVSTYVTLDRETRDFSSRDLQVLTLLQPLLQGYETSLFLRHEIDRILAASQPDPEMERRLTKRERQILDLVAMGQSNAAIAYRLAISAETVRKHLENVYLKLDVNSRTEALTRTGRARSAASW